MRRVAAQRHGLNPAQAERLFYLLEELGEAQQAIGKILRHGYESRDPTKATPTYDDNRGGQDCWRNTSATNRETLARELGDVQRAINMLLEANDVSSNEMKADVAKGAPLTEAQKRALRQIVSAGSGAIERDGTFLCAGKYQVPLHSVTWLRLVGLGLISGDSGRFAPTPLGIDVAKKI